MSCDVSNDMCCDRNVLELHKLCAECAKICWVKAKKVWVDQEVANDVCSQSVTAAQLNADKANLNFLCAQSGVINSLCVDHLTVTNMKMCNRYRATSVLSSNQVYTLGGVINWDVVLDDPNGNMLAGSYTVPKSGYYSLSFNVSMNGLTGSSVIAGVPVSVLSVKVNGLPFRSSYEAFLSFNPAQIAALSSVVLLNAGDVVTCLYDVQVIDPSTGLMNYVGSVNLEGNGSFPAECSFGIILMSELCVNQTSCQVCPPVVIPCLPVTPPDCDDSDMPVGMNSCVPCSK